LTFGSYCGKDFDTNLCASTLNVAYCHQSSVSALFSVVTNNTKVSVVILSRNHSIRPLIIQIRVVLVVVVVLLLLLLVVVVLLLLVVVVVVLLLLLVVVVVVIVVLFTAGVLYVQHLTLDVATRRNTNIV